MRNGCPYNRQAFRSLPQRAHKTHRSTQKERVSLYLTRKGFRLVYWYFLGELKVFVVDTDEEEEGFNHNNIANRKG